MAAMADAFVRHLEAFKKFASAAQPLRVEDQVKWRKDLTEKLSALPTLSLQDATTITTHLEGVFPENRDEFVSIVQKKVTAAAGSTGKNRALQNWKLFPLYLFGRHWDAIFDNSVPRQGFWDDFFPHFHHCYFYVSVSLLRVLLFEFCYQGDGIARSFASPFRYGLAKSF